MSNYDNFPWRDIESAPSQQAVLIEILKFGERAQHSPTVRELGRAMGKRAGSNIHRLLVELESKEYIDRVEDQGSSGQNR